MSAESSGEKQFAPTARRLKDAARKGDVLRSKDLATAAGMLAGIAWLAFAGPYFLARILDVLRRGFDFDRSRIEAGPGPQDLIGIPSLLLGILGLGLLVSAASVLSQLAHGEGRWVSENLAFKGRRLSPLSGLKRMFGLNGLVEIGKGLLKVALLGAIFAAWAHFSLGEIGNLARLTLSAQIVAAWDAVLTLMWALAGGLVIIAMVDLPIQILRRSQRLRMSHADMKEETKQSEGSPEMRAARRQRQRDIATGAVSAAMRDAQFVITNPARFAVAMAWDQTRASAPVVLAKGRAEKAMAIRELAADRDIPVLEYPPLARALYFTTREKQMIREELYTAVAMIVAFVLSVRRGEKPRLPVVSLPATMQFDSEGRLQP